MDLGDTAVSTISKEICAIVDPASSVASASPAATSKAAAAAAGSSGAESTATAGSGANSTPVPGGSSNGASTPPSSSASSTGSNGPSTATMAGAAVGGVAGLALIIGAMVYFHRLRRRIARLEGHPSPGLPHDNGGPHARADGGESGNGDFKGAVLGAGAGGGRRQAASVREKTPVMMNVEAVGVPTLPPGYTSTTPGPEPRGHVPLPTQAEYAFPSSRGGAHELSPAGRSPHPAASELSSSPGIQDNGAHELQSGGGYVYASHHDPAVHELPLGSGGAYPYELEGGQGGL